MYEFEVKYHSNGCKETDTVRYDYLQNNVKSPQKKKYMHTHYYITQARPPAHYVDLKFRWQFCVHDVTCPEIPLFSMF